jgi:hypothetical protein
MDNQIEKIKKLLALGNAGEDHESLLALDMASRLMAKWGIDELDLMINQEGLDNLGNLDRNFIYRSGRIPYWRTCLLHALCSANHCKSMIIPGAGLLVYGHDANFQKISLLWDIICPQIDSWTKNRCAGMGRTYASSYRLGIVETLRVRLTANHNALIAEKSSQEQTALMTVSDKIRKEVDDFISQKLGKVTQYSRSTRNWSNEGFQQGKADGNNIQTESGNRKALT